MGLRPFHFLLFAAFSIALTVQGDDGASRVTARKDSLEKITLRIEPNGWGDASRNDLSEVLHSCCGELAVHFTGDQLGKLEPIRIRHDEEGPMTVFQRTVRGEILVLLDSKDRFWCQHAYQMSHELAHVLCRNKKADRSNLWFEESLCELASIYVLRQMAISWQIKPPYRNWRGYSRSLEEYADDLITKYTPDEPVDLAKWYEANADSLKINGTDRARNGIVAMQLLPMFEKNPRNWRAIYYINVGVNQAPKTFNEYLQAWHRNCPEDNKPFVALVAEKFGMSF
jgi:hypothetical protein